MPRSDRLAYAVLATVGIPLLSLLIAAELDWATATPALAALGLGAGGVTALRVRDALAEVDPVTSVQSRPTAPVDDDADHEPPGGLVADRPEPVDPAPVAGPVNPAGDDIDAGHSRAMLERSSEVFVVVDRQLTVVEASPSVEQLIGLPRHSVVGAPVADLLDHSTVRMLNQLVGRSATDLDGTVLDVDIQTADGQAVLSELAIAPAEALDQPDGLLLILRDVTALRRLEDSLRSRAVLDQPTGLLNRSSFEYEVQASLRRLPPGHEAAVVTLSILDFEEVNDAVGFNGGSRILIEVANRLRTSLRGVDALARLAEEDFALAAIGPSERSLRRLAERMAWLFEEPFEIDGHAHHLRVAVGMAGTTDRRTEVGKLMQSASIALHRAKGQGNDEVVVYDQTLQDQIDQRFELTAALRPALRHNEFRLVYQPLICLQTGRVESFEALLRWRHPSLGEISPGAFIPLAEKSGTIVELGRWVMDQACHQLVDWRRRLDGYDELSIGINLSARQLERHGELDALIYILEGAGLDPTSVTVELTESAMIDDAGWIGSQLQHLRELGTRIAIDDFGTGVAGLSHLRELPYDLVKIDRSYIERVGVEPAGERLVGQIIELARGLGAQSVAEGIEEESQAVRLGELGCDIGQGFHLAHPMERAELERWMAARQPQAGRR